MKRRNYIVSAVLALYAFCHPAAAGDSIVTFNEIMYHAATNEASLEWVELRNQLSIDVDMSAWRLRGGIEYDVPEGTVIPGRGFLVVASSPTALAAASTCTNAVGPFDGQLSNGGEELRLRNNSGRLMDELDYRDGGDWPSAPDGSGATLAKVTPNAATAVPENWSWSAALGGSPGSENALATPGDVSFNEIAAATNSEFWVELVNTGPHPESLVGFSIAIRGASDAVYDVTSGTLAAGGHLSVGEADLGFEAVDEDTLFLFHGGGVVDSTVVKNSPRGRLREGVGDWLRPSAPTPGSTNTFDLNTDVVINEIMYHQRPQQDPCVGSDEEWVELYNRGTSTVDLAGWGLDEGIGFDFPTGTVLAAGEYVVVAWDVDQMLALHPSLTNGLLGPFSGRLNGRTDLLVLRDTSGNPADAVRYYDSGRWPKAADGYGASLELRDPDSDNAIAESWEASHEFERAEWRSYTNRGAAAASQVGPDGQWHEFIMGLNTVGEVLIDDVSVVENPNGTATEFMQNGSFESDAIGSIPAGWRIIGNHRHSEVIVDPADPANQVLRLVATGPTEHMHNHAETTLAGGEAVVNGVEYEITFRARWVRQSAQLNTRLYFNRLAGTFRLDTPTRTGTPGTRNSCYAANIGPAHEDIAHSPVVPAAGQPVTVTTTVSDPDGVGGVTNWYSVDEGAWTALPMVHQGGGVYTATIPGQSASDIVHVYVESRDSLGAVSLFPAGGADARALYKVDDGAAATNGRNNFRIVMLPSEAAWMRVDINHMSNDRIGCTVIYNEHDVYYNAGVRHKGSERHRGPDNEVGFITTFPSDNLFQGVHKSAAVDRTQGVGFGQREMLINLVMNRAGGQVSRYSDFIKVLAPLTVHTSSAELQLARYGDGYLDGQFDDGSDGQVYEYEFVYYPRSTDNGTPEGNKLPQPDGVQGTTLRSLGADKEQYRWIHMIKNNRDRSDYTRYMEYLPIMAMGNPSFNQQARDYIDVDQWLRFLAVGTASGCADNFAQNSGHNAQFYVRPSDQRVLFLPHDMDAFHSTTRPLVGNSYLSKLMADAGNARQYYGHMYNILTTSYNATYIQRWTDQLSSLSDEQNFEQFRTFIGQRHDFLMGELHKNISTNDTAFSVTNETLVVDADSIALGGNGWIDVYEVRVAGQDRPLTLTWDSAGSGTSRTFSWQGVVPLAPGENVLDVLAYDFQGTIVGSNTVTVISTIGERPVQDHLRLTELMYNPIGGSSLEFLELQNTSTQTMDISHVSIVDGIDFSFSGSAVTSLPPGAHVVVARDLTAFSTRYDTSGMLLAGEYAGKLANDGEAVAIEGRWGVSVLAFEYRDGRGWPTAADGTGHALVPRASAIATEPEGSLYYGRNWRSGTYVHGSPGAADPAIENDLVINEILAHTDYTDPARPEYDSNDCLELYNPATSVVSLASWYLSDDSDDLMKWAIPATNAVPGGGWIAFDEVSGFHNPITSGFGLNKAGEDVYLSYLPGDSRDRVADAVSFKGQDPDVSIGRYPDGGEFRHPQAPSLSASNQPSASHVVIDEFIYEPALGEYIEIHNPLGSTAELWTVAGPWRIDGGVSFQFPPSSTLDPGESLVLVRFDPVSDPPTRDAFLDRYGLTNGQVRMMGPFNGSLSDIGERLAIERPQPGDAVGESVSYVIVDEAIYFSQSPWPSLPGEGRPLQRASDAGCGNDPGRWYIGLEPTPGSLAAKVGIVSPSINAELLMPVSIEVVAAVDGERVAGSVAYVEFFLDGTVSLGKDYAAPYDAALTWQQVATPGPYVLTAVLHDDEGASVSAPRNVVVYESMYPDSVYRMKVQFPGYTGDETLRKLPALVNLIDALPGFSYSQMASPTGGDLRFADSTGTNAIYHEIETWDTNGTSAVWVRLPELVATGTWIWTYWGDTNATLPGYATDGSVWGEDYDIVLHLSDSSGSATLDASPNGHAAGFAGFGTWAWGSDGAIGDAAQVSDSWSYISLGTGIPLGAEWTISSWFKDLDGTTGKRTLTETGGYDSPAAIPSGGNALGMYIDPGQNVPSGATLAPDGGWRRLTVVGNEAGTRYFIDGGRAGAITNRFAGALLSAGNRSTGASVERFALYLDEFRVSRVARSTDWIAATWLNQASNDLFVTFGAAERQHPTGEPVADGDGDGMDDEWEDLYLGGIGADPDDDADRDGMTNLEEFIAGTNPTNGLSLFDVSLVWSNGQLCVEFQTQSERYYALESNTNIPVPTSWRGIGGYTNIPGVGQSVIFTNPADAPPQSFRGSVWRGE